MDPITLSLLLMGGGALLKGGTQLGFGLTDRAKGKRLEEAAGDRPEYEIPESVDNMISMYQQMAGAGLPGEDLMKQDIQSQTASTVGQIGQLADSPVAALGALGSAKEREMNAMRDLQVRSAQYQAQAQQNYANAVGSRASYEDQAWRQNELLPWEIDMNRAAQLQTSGSGNIMGAADTFGSTMTQMGSMMGSNAMYNQMYPSAQAVSFNPSTYIPSQGMTSGQMIQQGSQKGGQYDYLGQYPTDKLPF